MPIPDSWRLRGLEYGILQLSRSRGIPMVPSSEALIDGTSPSWTVRSLLARASHLRALDGRETDSPPADVAGLPLYSRKEMQL